MPPVQVLEFDDQDTVDEVVLLIAGFEFAYVAIMVYHEAFIYTRACHYYSSTIAFL